MEEINKAEIMESVVSPVVARSASIAVTNDQENMAAAEFLKSIKRGVKTVKEKFGPAVRAAHEAHKKLKALENECLAPLNQAERIIKGKMGEYHAECERKRLEAQRQAEELARKEREKLERKAERLRAKGKEDEANITEVMASAVVSAPVIEQTKVDGVSYVDNWTAEIVDVSKLPREYMIPNMQALNALGKATKGSVQIPGVKFVNNKTIRARS